MSQSEKLLSPSEVMQILDIPRHKLTYLFETRRLKSEDFTTIGNRRLYKQSDLTKIRKALFEIGNK